MVDKSYMEAKPAPPSALKQYFDQVVMPVAIDMAGSVEAGLERVAVSVKQRPATTLGAALVLGAAVSGMTLRLMVRRRRRW